MTRARRVGQTATVGFQIGVRRTLPVSPEEVWKVLTSPEGRQDWLGNLEDVRFTESHNYETVEGTTGEFRVVKPLHQIRLTWQPKNWPQPSTLQIRLIAIQAGRTTISFHQEKLAGEQQREAMKLRWEIAIANLHDRIKEYDHD
ncbi:SRPBCC domain-containing protein [Paenibacillus sp. SYP-B3998]|uniref:SRPBCC domain-containing protein n=1 Tax=Paenibacillus sp. SYP-B3998 TaxID=2678564 RepID=A0A6G3ZX90_9BACL|nr:SRPBCC domain-containing protein [Paenibacillus sp. SYP-B3998]NEW06752.1 SRPBCC domain-containing protein [Paenibacillus sp. SYP-B3998]